MPDATYQPRRTARSLFVPLRGLDYHCWVWGDPARATLQRPVLVAMHGWMDIGASFQFMVDAMAEDRCVIAADWRGFGLTAVPPVDSYWFADYLGDLDALLRAPALGLDDDTPLDLLGHSMGGNVVMTYAGARPARMRRLVNLEGFGLPGAKPDNAPMRMAQWLDELMQPQALRPLASADAVAQRLLHNNPRMDPAHAAWVAQHWAAPGAGGQWHIRGDAAHKRVNPVPYRRDEALAFWGAIEAPTLWVEGSLTRIEKNWDGRYTREDFEQRLAAVRRLQRTVLPDAGHMLHFDQPQALAAVIEGFLDAPDLA
ncbi:MAG: alpha/beta fold hydrolase [Aquabacterium sp.]